MAGNFSYSFDRDTYHGQYATRAEALAAGLKHLADEKMQGETVFVGKRIPFELGLDDLAENVLKLLQKRLRSEAAESTEPLLHVNEHQLADLDSRLQQAVKDWLVVDQLLPSGGKVTAISEHATASSASDALK